MINYILIKKINTANFMGQTRPLVCSLCSIPFCSPYLFFGTTVFIPIKWVRMPWVVSHVWKYFIGNNYLVFERLEEVTYKPICTWCSLFWKGYIFGYLFNFLLKKDFTYLFIFRGRRKKGERAGEKHWSVASHRPPLGTKSQPRQVPWPRSELMTFRLQGDAQPTEPHRPGLCF